MIYSKDIYQKIGIFFSFFLFWQLYILQLDIEGIKYMYKIYVMTITKYVFNEWILITHMFELFYTFIVPT